MVQVVSLQSSRVVFVLKGVWVRSSGVATVIYIGELGLNFIVIVVWSNKPLPERIGIILPINHRVLQLDGFRGVIGHHGLTPALLNLDFTLRDVSSVIECILQLLVL